MHIEIVRAERFDAAEILALQKIAYQSEARLNDDGTIPPLTQTLAEIEAEFTLKRFLKALRERRIVGSVRAALESGTCRIGRLIVHPDDQGKGIGSRLLAGIERAFPEARRFEVFTGTRSTANIGFYEKRGYRACGEAVLTPKVRIVFLEKMQAGEQPVR